MGRPTNAERSKRLQKEINAALPDAAKSTTEGALFDPKTIVFAAAKLLEAQVYVRDNMLLLVKRAMEQALTDNAMNRWMIDRFFGRTPEARETFMAAIERVQDAVNDVGQPTVPTKELLTEYGMEGLAIIRRRARNGDLEAAMWLARHAIGEPEQSLAVRVSQMSAEEARENLYLEAINAGMTAEQAERFIDGKPQLIEGETAEGTDGDE